MWHIIVTVLIGFFAGLIARALHPGEDKAGFFVTAGLGILGSVVATYAGRFLNIYGEQSSAGFIASVVGAILVLVAYNFFTKEN
ncbi:GlsB/YeaQ/YmgE family stress response membrane protein [Acinetobacter sp. B5B]|uniref:GlsB/YeaQ/YmgE family stress response membrane protein n=1 Tax=Acinetobacter baretiae TaxID=2605383 RepID=UPI0018C2C3B8|nr:GlsB/YeaQ/YmgE family stress response membrane protein [Acinetobacter baretiae]MBF7683797.1 GlsB/YeaQ/YmgE family stress response membrane protein [Acinetobacter baretiae]MBF7686396.1 GlsB/YeaQ/YmgE family stress response membrane protein [Acinetobacter baretiae]